MDIEHNTAIYTFTVWKCIIRLRICEYCSPLHIRLFGINMTPTWHHCIFICFIYMMCFFTRTFALRILAIIFQFFLIPITKGYLWWMYTFSRNAKFTTTHDPITYRHFFKLWWQQWMQYITIYNNIMIFVPSIFDTTIIGITYKYIIQFSYGQLR